MTTEETRIPFTSPLTDYEMELLNYSDFKEFKKQFPVSTTIVNFMNIFLAVRTYLENVMSQTYGEVREGHKKHAWLNQKIHDMLKFNSGALMQQKILEHRKQIEQPFPETASEQIAEDTTGGRRFNVVPGSEV